MFLQLVGVKIIVPPWDKKRLLTHGNWKIVVVTVIWPDWGQKYDFSGSDKPDNHTTEGKGEWFEIRERERRTEEGKEKTEKAVVAILDIGFIRDDHDDINWLQMRKEGPRAIVNDSPKRDGPKPNDMKWSLLVQNGSFERLAELFGNNLSWIVENMAAKNCSC